MFTFAVLMIVPAALVVHDPISHGRPSLQQQEEVLEGDGVIVVLLWVWVSRDVNLHGINSRRSGS